MSVPLRLMKDRRYEVLPIDKIVVLNSRDREQERFSENVQSIQTVGLLKPVLVNERFYPSTGKYELVCGEGRLIAHQRLGKTDIRAEVIDCDRKEAYLLSLIENIARVPAGTMWFAGEMKRMHDEGLSYADIARIVGKSETNVLGYVNLVERGEERLLRGVEQGIFPMHFAMQVAESDDSRIQDLLMDAFDSGIVKTTNIYWVRKIIKERMKSLGVRHHPRQNDKKPEYTVNELKRDIAKTCREQKAYVREAEIKESRLVGLIATLKVLRADKEFKNLVHAEGLGDAPVLQGPHKL